MEFFREEIKYRVREDYVTLILHVFFKKRARGIHKKALAMIARALFLLKGYITILTMK